MILILTIFSGDLQSRPTFWDQFKANIHSRTDLSPVAIFSYTFGVVHDTTDSNYTLAVSLLTATYEKIKIAVLYTGNNSTANKYKITQPLR